MIEMFERISLDENSIQNAHIERFGRNVGDPIVPEIEMKHICDWSLRRKK